MARVFDPEFPLYRACTVGSNKAIRSIIASSEDDDHLVLGYTDSYKSTSVSKSSVKLIPQMVHFSSYQNFLITDDPMFDQFRTPAELEALGREYPAYLHFAC